MLPAVLARTECARVSGMYGDACTFRSRVIMGRHGFGRGEYQYFADPLPEPVGALRESFYRCVAPIANEWEAQLGSDRRFPTTLAAFRQQCRDAGQRRPTPLLLKYEPGDYNCLHQDLYGALDFPLQLAVLLSQPGDDFEGGEFVLTEQRPRMQSRVQVVPLARGDGVLFATNFRPVRGARGIYRSRVRHGVSTVRSGRRYTLGIIFHDAE